MSDLTDDEILSPIGKPAPVVRFIGWATLTVLAAFLVNNILIVWYGFPTLQSVFSGDDARVWLILAIYLIAIVGAGWWVISRSDNALRHEARAISAFNAYLIRACFFAILFVGVADFVIAFLRVENLLTGLFGEAAGRELLRARFLGPYVHFPLMIVAFVVALFSRTLGFQWLALLIVAAAWVLLSRTLLGFALQVQGAAPRAARHAGFSSSRLTAFALLSTGAVAGLAGLFEVAGPIGQLQPTISPGYGFTAIIVAFLGRLHPVGIVFAGLVMALSYLGGESAQISLNLPLAVTGVFQGMLLFFLLATDVLIHYRLVLPGVRSA